MSKSTSKNTAKNASKKSANKHQRVTKISAKSPSDPQAPLEKSKKALKKSTKHSQKAQKSEVEKPLRQVFILIRPFVAIARYLRDSWRELRQVRWPNRGATWKMTLAVLIYCAIFIVFITLLDSLFTFIFNLLLNQVN